LTGNKQPAMLDSYKLFKSYKYFNFSFEFGLTICDNMHRKGCCMTKVSMTKARRDFTDIAQRVMYGDERICIQKNNKAAFALVPVEDVEILEALEDQIDVQAAKAAIKKGKFIDLEILAKQLGV